MTDTPLAPDAPRPGFAVTLALIALNVGMFLFLAVGQGLSWTEPSNVELTRWGANVSALTLTGDTWRLLSSMFLHGGIVHLLMNMYMLLVLGLVAEARFRSFPMLCTYLATGLVGSALSALWNANQKVMMYHPVLGTPLGHETLRVVVSVGASGALMGLAGALLVEALRNKLDETPEAEGGKMLPAIAQVVGLNLLLGAFMDGIDQAAHVGGLMAGVGAGLLLLMRDGSRAARWVVAPLVVACGAGIALWTTRLGNSGELRELRAELVAELNPGAPATAEPTDDAATLEHEAKRHAAEQRRQAEAQAIEDAQRAPAPVDAAIAAGTRLELATLKAIDLHLGASGERLYVVDNQGNQLIVVGVKDRTVLRRIDGPRLPTSKDGCADNVCRGVGAAGVAVTRDERWAYVSSMTRDALSIVDLATGAIEASVPVGRFPRAVALSPDESLVYVLNGADNSLSVIDAATRQAVGRPVPIGVRGGEGMSFGRPLGLWAEPSGQHLFVLNGEGGVDVLNADSMSRLTGLAPAYIHSAAMSGDARLLFLAGEHGLQVFDTSTLQEVEAIPACGGLLGARWAVNHDGTLIAFSEPSSGTVRLIKRQTRRTVAAFPASGATRVLSFVNHEGLLLALGDRNSLALLDPGKSLDVSELTRRAGEVLCWLEP